MERQRREAEKKKAEAAAYAKLQRGRAVVGKPVRVQWKGGERYVGRVTEYSEDDGKHKVEYTDGGVNWHDLDQMKWSEVTEEEHSLDERREAEQQRQEAEERARLEAERQWQEAERQQQHAERQREKAEESARLEAERQSRRGE